MKKRILSILLLCCMVLTLLPTAAFAANELPDVKLSVPATFDKTVDLTKQNGELKIKDSKTYLIKGSADPNWYFQYRIKIDGKNNTPHIFLDGVRIQAPKDGPAIELYGGASACLYFIGNDSELIGAENFAALQKNKTDGYLRVLVQTGTKLTCEGGRYGAGIGGSKVGIKKFSQGHGMNLHFGSLATGIYGGEILAISGVYGAGIGGGQGGVGEWIYVYSGKLTVRSVSEGAGIGGGQGGPGRFIYIKGGTVNAGSESGGAGIGSGDQDGQNKSEDAHHIEISGGTVEAWSNYAGAGIGGGRGGSGYDISITGGVVRAQGYYGAGIGGGMKGKSGNILIKDTTLTALALPLYPSSDYDYNYQPASAVGRGSKWVHWMTVMQDQEFAMTLEENIKIEASDGKSVRLSATGWQWRRSQREYERGWGTTTELLIGHVDLQRLSLPYAYNYGRVISELELRCEESTHDHEFGWAIRDDCHIWACKKCGARDPAAEMSKQNGKHSPGDWSNQKQLCTVCGHVLERDTKAPVMETLTDGESYTVEDTLDGKPGAYTFTVSDPAASGETSSGVKSVTITDVPQDGPTYRLPAPDGGNNDAGAEYTVVATDNAGNETTATVRIYRRHHEHNYGDWSKDGTSHWHECTDYDCPNRNESIKDKAAHVYTDDADTTCNTCDYDRSVTPPAPTEYTITVTSGGNGTASASHAKAMAGAEITLTATPNKGYHFKEWQVMSGGVTIKDDKFTMPSANVEVKAIFEEDVPAPTDPDKPSISVTGAYTYNGSEQTATVSGYDPATMDISGNTGTDAGDYTVRVTSKTGKWADGSTDAVTAAWSIGKATQEAPDGLIGVEPTTEGGSDGKISGVTDKMEYRMAGESSYTACSGAEIDNLSAGHYFVRYAEDNNHFASSDAEVTVGEGASLADFNITFDGNGGSGNMGPVTVVAGTNYILPACGFTAPADQEFKAWQIGGTEYKVGDSYTVLGDTEIKALWENSVITPTTYTVTVSNDGNGTGTATPSTAAAGTTITLTATPNKGYHFKEWEVISGGVTITNNKFTMPNNNVEVKAIFEEDTPPAPTEYTVTVTSGGNGTASASHAKAVAGTEIRLTATPKTGYHLKEWQVISGGVTIKDDKFLMPDSDVEVKAIFEKDAPPAEDLVDPMIRIIPGEYGYPAQSGTLTAADFFQPGKAPANAKITAIAPPNALAILDSISVDNDGTLSYKKEDVQGIELKTETYTVTITSDDCEPVSAPLTVRQYLYAGFGVGYHLGFWVYGDTRTYKWQVTNPGENGVWSAIMREQGIFEIYEETVDTTSEPGVSHYTMKVRAIKAGHTFIDILYVSDTTASWSPWTYSSVVAGGPVTTRTLTVTAGSATITEGDALPTDLVRCTGLLDSEGRKDDRDTVLDNALGYQLLDASGVEVAAATARNTPGTYTVVPAATLKSGWDERYSLNRVNGTLTVEDKVEFTVTVTSGGNGTVSASHAKAVAGTEITLTATPDKGYHFKEWQVISGGVTIKDNKFTMPNAHVEVKAIFEEDVPAPTEFIVTFDGNGGTPSVGSLTTTNQKLSSLPSASRSGRYSFDGWYTEKSGGTKITKDTVFHADTTVYAHWTYTGGGSSYSYYTIKATAGTGGSISPSGNVSVREGRDQTFTITPDKGYAVANVKIDGKSIGAVKSYTFENVRRTHTIEVIFMKANGNPQTGVFVDVATGSYYEDAVDWAVENGITKGTDDTYFSPDGICTRAQAVTFLWRTAGSPEPETRTMPFTDVPVGSYYYDAVLWAVENGITKGTSDTTFSPDDTCTRAQIVAFLWRSEKSPAAGSRNPFADVKSTAYYADAVLWAVREDITKGTTNTTFSPNADCSRAQIVTFLWRCKK